jgi:hypothetical protein
MPYIQYSDDLKPLSITLYLGGDEGEFLEEVTEETIEMEFHDDEPEELSGVDIRIRRLGTKLMEEAEDAGDAQPAMATSCMTDLAHLVFLAGGMDPENLSESTENFYAEFEQGLFRLMRAAFANNDQPEAAVQSMDETAPETSTEDVIR